MSHLFLFISLLLFHGSVFSALKKWDGGGGDDQWNNPLNWNDNVVPGSSDNVLLDNSFRTLNYTVKLPSGNVSVTVKSIMISPGTGKTIELILPSNNIASSALVATGPGYGMIIASGGIFRNASGATSGTPVKVSDSIRVKSGGRWVHATARSHSENIQALSGVIGTDKGIFEFDIPVASTTISLSGRIFGRLILSSSAAGGNINYTAVGTSRVNIRENLEIGTGVTCSLNFSDTLFVGGDFIQYGGTLNLGTTNRAVVLAVNENISQSATGTITETGSGVQEILLSGSQPHTIDLRGNILNQVALTINGAGPVALNAPLSLPYQLSLQKGVLTTSMSNMLHLLAACSISADASSNLSYINGPVQKDGLHLADFLFPVGNPVMQRWVQLKNATGNFTVQYFRSNPHTLSSTTGTGLHHISQMEYWSIMGSQPADNAAVTLSFNDPQSGGVTALPALRVGRLTNGIWENAGNTASGGSAGANGWVSSAAVGGFSAGNIFFALASSTAQENPLPLSSILLHAARRGTSVLFRWQLATEDRISVFELEKSSDGIHFETIARFQYVDGMKTYGNEQPMISGERLYYRIRAWGEQGTSYFSRIVAIAELKDKQITLWGKTISSSELNLSVLSARQTYLHLIISDVQGTVCKKISTVVNTGVSCIHVPLTGMARGVYYIIGLANGERTNVFRFIKVW